MRFGRQMIPFAAVSLRWPAAHRPIATMIRSQASAPEASTRSFRVRTISCFCDRTVAVPSDTHVRGSEKIDIGDHQDHAVPDFCWSRTAGPANHSFTSRRINCGDAHAAQAEG